jgi:hypothetical protein
MPGHSGSTSQTQLESVESSKQTSSETRGKSTEQQEANTNQSLEDLERNLQEHIERLVETIENNPSNSRAESIRVAEQIASAPGGANYSAKALAVDLGNDPQAQKLKDDEKELNSLRNLESTAKKLIEAGNYEEARELLKEASNNPDSVNTILAEKQQRDLDYERLTQQEKEKQQQSLEYIRTEADKLKEKTIGIEKTKAEIKKLEKEAQTVKPQSTSRGSRGGQPKKYRELQQAIKNRNIGLGISESEQARDIQRINERERSYQDTQTRLNEAAELRAQGKTREALQVLSGESLTVAESLKINLEREEAYTDLPKEERDARIYSDRVDERLSAFEAGLEEGNKLLESADSLEPEHKQAIETRLQRTQEVLDQLKTAREGINEAIEKGEFDKIAKIKVQEDALTYRAELQDSINQFRESIISSRQITEQSTSRSNDPNLSSEERQRIADTLEQNSANEHRAVRELEKALTLHDHITDLIDDDKFTEIEELTSGEVSFEYEQEYGAQNKADELLRQEPKLTLEETEQDIKTLTNMIQKTQTELLKLSQKSINDVNQDMQYLRSLNPIVRNILSNMDYIGGGFSSSLQGNVDRHLDLANHANRITGSLTSNQLEAQKLVEEGKVREARELLKQSLSFAQQESFDSNSKLSKHYSEMSGKLERNLDNALETGRKVGIMVVAATATIASAGTASSITVPIMIGTASGTAFGFSSEVLVSQTDSNKSIADGLLSATKKLPGDALLSLETAVSSAVGVRTAGGLESLASTGGRKALTQALANSISKMSPAGRAALTGSASGAAGASTGALKEVVESVYRRQEISNQIRESLAEQKLSEEEIQAKIQAEYKSQGLDNQSLIRNTALAISSGAASGAIGGLGSHLTRATPILNAAGKQTGEVQKSLAYRAAVGLAEEVVNATVATAEVLARGVDPSSPEFADALITNITQSGISKAAAKAGLDKASTYKYEGVRRAADTQPKITVSDKLPKGVDASTTVRYRNDGKPLGLAEVTLSPDLKAAVDSGDSSAMARYREETQAHAKEKPLDPLYEPNGTLRKEALTQEAYFAIRAQNELAMQIKGEALQAKAEGKEVSGLKQDTKTVLAEMNQKIENKQYKEALEIAKEHGIDQKYLDQYSKDYTHNSDPNRTHLEQTSFATRNSNESKTKKSTPSYEALDNQITAINNKGEITAQEIDQLRQQVEVLGNLSDKQRQRLSSQLNSLDTSKLSISEKADLAYLTGKINGNPEQRLSYEVDLAISNKYRESGNNPQVIKDHVEALAPKIEAQITELQKLQKDGADEKILAEALGKLERLNLEMSAIRGSETVGYIAKEIKISPQIESLDSYRIGSHAESLRNSDAQAQTQAKDFIKDLGLDPEQRITRDHAIEELGAKVYKLEVGQTQINENTAKELQDIFDSIDPRTLTETTVAELNKIITDAKKAGADTANLLPIRVTNDLPKGVQAKNTVRYDNEGNLLSVDSAARHGLLEAARNGNKNAQAIIREEAQAHAKEKPLDPLKTKSGKPMPKEAYIAIRAQRELAMQVKGKALQAQAEGANVSSVKQNTKDALVEMTQAIKAGNYSEAMRIAEENGVGKAYSEQFAKDYDHNVNPDRSHLEQTSFSKAISKITTLNSNDLARKINTNNDININQIQDLINTSKNPELVRALIDQAAQFTNLDSINALGNLRGLLGDNYALLTDGKGGTVDILNYAKKKITSDTSPEASEFKKNLPEILNVENFSHIDINDLYQNNKGIEGVALILDQQMLSRLENDTTLVQQLKELRDTHGLDLAIINPQGLTNGFTPFLNHADFNTTIKSLESKAQDIIKNNPDLSQAQAIERALNHPIEETLAKIGLEDCLLTIENEAHTTASSDADLAQRFENPKIDPQKLESFIKETSAGDPEKEIALRSIFEHGFQSLSLPDMGALAKKQHADISKIAQDKSIAPENIYYLVPKENGAKSYQYATNIYLTVNNIDSSKVINNASEIPSSISDKSMIVIIDDNSLSGQSQLKNYVGLRNNNYNGQIAIAPMVSSTYTKALFTSEHPSREAAQFANEVKETVIAKFAGSSPKETQKIIADMDFDRVHHVPGIIHQTFNESAAYKALPEKSKQLLESWFLSQTGHNGSTTGLVFPFMSPNNNLLLFSASGLLETLTLNGAGVQNARRRQ